MKRTIDYLIRLYPKPWRDRYGSEFQALLEDVQPGWQQVANVIWGAFKMQLSQSTSAKIVAAFAAAGLLIASVSGIVTHARYVSTAVVRTPDDSGILARAEQTVLRRTSIASLVMQNDLYHAERERQPLEDVIETMRTRDIHISVERNRTVRISFAADDPRRSQRITDLLMQRLNFEMHAIGGKGFQLIDSPSLPQAPISPNRLLAATAGLVIGTLAGLLFALLRKLRGQTLRFASAFGAAGLCLSLLGSYLLIPNRYISRSVIRVQRPGDAQAVASELRAAAARRNLKGVGVRASPIAVVVSVPGEDPSTAQQINSELITLALRSDFAKRIDVLDPATYPASPAFPNRPIISLLGLAAGILLGAATSRFRTAAPG